MIFATAATAAFDRVATQKLQGALEEIAAMRPQLDEVVRLRQQRDELIALLIEAGRQP